MSSARNDILARLRQHPVQRLEAIPTVPRVAIPDLEAAFVEALRHWQGEVLSSSAATWQRDLAGFLRNEGIDRLLCGRDLAVELAPPLAQLVRIYDQDLETLRPEIFAGIPAGLSRARAGLARTGSLFVTPHAGEPATISLVPPLHVALLDRSEILPDLPELLASPHFPRDMPRNLLLITGPSKTADIQQTLAFGAHGPKRLVVLLT